MLTAVKEEMARYYKTMEDPFKNENFNRIYQLIHDDIHEFYKNNPKTPTVLLKSRLHTKIAEFFEPVIFLNSPFFYEMGLRPTSNWGVPNEGTASIIVRSLKWNELYSKDTFTDVSVFDRLVPTDVKIPVYQGSLNFDEDHHCLGYTTLLLLGINGILNNIEKEKNSSEPDSEKYSFLLAAEESCNAILTIAKKFAVAAKNAISSCSTEKQKKYMEMIASAGDKIPANPPETFYEGLAMLWFLREATATIEGIGISVIGHIDKHLGMLYENDIKNGRISEDEARELLALWVVPTDIKWNLHSNAWPETSTCMELGGCDADGKPVYNEVTRLVIEVHKEHGFINPKLNCRYSKNSPEEYFNLLSRTILSGHNNFALANDDTIIPSLVKGGVSEKDARFYVNGGCQETMIEGMGHSAGAYFYLMLPTLLDYSLRKSDADESKLSNAAKSALPEIIKSADSFDDFYEMLIKNTDRLLNFILRTKTKTGLLHRHLHPCPFFSATQTGCIENGADYTAGGAKYNFSTVCACGIGTMADSLYVIKTLVFDCKEITLQELTEALSKNWEGYEELRQKCISLPKYGHGIDDVDCLAQRFIDSLNSIITKIPNERSDSFIMSMFVYYEFKNMATILRATPDGRKNSEMVNQGIAPGRLCPVKSITDSVATVKNVDYTRIPGNSVLDIQLPMGGNITDEILAAYIKSAGASGVATLQPNAVSVSDLKDAKIHPEKHRNLIVRISGLSAYFVALNEDVQDEIISRHLYTC